MNALVFLLLAALTAGFAARRIWVHFRPHWRALPNVNRRNAAKERKRKLLASLVLPAERSSLGTDQETMFH